MAARVLRQRRAAPLAATVVMGFALAPRIAYAEAPEGSQSKKPIYDDVDLTTPTSGTLPPPTSRTEQPLPPPAAEEPSKPRGPTPTERLAVQIGKARLGLYQYAVGAEDAVNRTMDRAFNLEQSFTSTIASLAPARESGEKLMPGAIYVLVAAMAGSIITRNRNVVLRAAAPVALGITAGWTVLPITMGNVSNLTWKYEQRFPVIAQGHLKIRESIENSWRQAKLHSQIGVRYVDEKVTDARGTVEDWVKKGK
ncbi:MICOS subunit MIC26 [Colletotrichum sidae]|uniref:MICOS complex subunit n=1 Tax=Colletotrichum sidae TaxID=1347389 RepID=A0A4V3I4G3_9PEZI|nr:MICOS subunit MIC26 [Colletotrichum sidae]